MTRLLDDVLFPAVPRAPRGELPDPVLRALALDGCLAPVGDGWQPIDLPATPAIRAASVAPRLPDEPGIGLAAIGGRTAAWVHGALDRLETPLTVLVRPSGTMPAVDQPGAHLHQVELDEADVLRLGGVLVTTALRTAADLLRVEAGRYDERLALRLLREQRIEPAEVRTAIVDGRRLPGRRRALARLQLLLTR